MQEVGEVTVESDLADDRVHLSLDPVHFAQADGMDLIRVKVQRRVLADLLPVPGLSAGHGLGGERVARVGHVFLAEEREQLAEGRDQLFADRLAGLGAQLLLRSEEHTSELQSLMRISYAVFCLKTKKL